MSTTNHISVPSTEWDTFRRWQNTYQTAVHGYVELEGVYLDVRAFRSGGCNGHTAPRCYVCDPEITEDENDD